jgi:hypothetical protein
MEMTVLLLIRVITSHATTVTAALVSQIGNEKK